MRSLASESARQREDALSWYSADFREELSAFDGLLLVTPTYELAQETFSCQHDNHDTEGAFATQWQHQHVEPSETCMHELHNMHNLTQAVNNA